MTRMRIRWAVAGVSALALALFTMSVPLEWPFHRHDTVALILQQPDRHALVDDLILGQ